jgi:type II secretory pathway pseudopilin PulG
LASTSARARTAGFSTLEALVALLLIALIGALVSQAVSGSTRGARGARARATAAVRLLQLDAALRRAVGSVGIPYWMGPVEPRAGGAAIILPFVGGEEKRTLKVEALDGSIVLTVVDEAAPADAPPAQPPLRLGPFAEARVEPILEGGSTWGVLATVRVDGQIEPVELRARIGSRPLPEGGGR